jgi:hypothetical protein
VPAAVGHPAGLYRAQLLGTWHCWYDYAQPHQVEASACRFPGDHRLLFPNRLDCLFGRLSTSLRGLMTRISRSQ